MSTENLRSKRKLLRLRWDQMWQCGREESSDKITSSHPLGLSLVSLIFLDLFPKPFFQGALATCILNRSTEDVIECVSVSRTSWRALQCIGQVSYCESKCVFCRQIFTFSWLTDLCRKNFLIPTCALFPPIFLFSVLRSIYFFTFHPMKKFCGAI